MDDTKKGISRRNFLVNGSAAVGACGLAAGITAGTLIRPAKVQAAETITLPLPVVQVNIEKVRAYAWEAYFAGACMHGTATGLMQAYKEECGGSDWDIIPYGMYQYGGGGVNTWGTICGCLNGAMAVLNLLGLHGTLGDALIGWYAEASFPEDNLTGNPYLTGSAPAPILDENVLAHTVAKSPLCHESISKFLAAAGQSILDKDDQGRSYKQDRCGKVAADTAAKTAELVNNYLAIPSVVPAWAVPAEYKSCYDCHWTDRHDMVAKMNCTECHTMPTKHGGSGGGGHK